MKKLTEITKEVVEVTRNNIHSRIIQLPQWAEKLWEQHLKPRLVGVLSSLALVLCLLFLLRLTPKSTIESTKKLILSKLHMTKSSEQPEGILMKSKETSKTSEMKSSHGEKNDTTKKNH